ncbi:MAG TPA: peptidylprolyl isomerase [Hyphomicrobiales bacterium]|nr:peptidylprolyl isomerase [Hyphomicrobiales bacterium]
MRFLTAPLFLAASLASLPLRAQDYVCMESTLGDFCLHLFRDTASRTVDNFLKYVKDGDYDNAIIHRSALTTSREPFVLQTGGYTLQDGRVLEIPTDPPVYNEFGRSNQRATVAMAKLGNNPNSATSQWFVNLSDNSANLDHQNGGFAVFAEVVTGMDVVDTIARLRRAKLDALGPAFTEVPVTSAYGVASVQTNDLVLIKHAYALYKLPSPYHCSINSPQDALAEFCRGAVTLPVMIGNEPYAATLQLVDTEPTLTLVVDKTTLRPLQQVPAEVARFDATSNTLYIPSLRHGDRLFRNISLNLVDKGGLRFMLDSFARF